ncbi:GDYXXLXY domain-containing protein [Psychrobacter sp. BF1]|uniref:GDYXXLXY domain-containing protein n=1 Tax=Psychrobacter sp. BF1 TaxID=2821147 RepID=UPI001C4E1757|nr:GDYXXLXY domain-containing protein [Psychrobacter sp. BF1]
MTQPINNPHSAEGDTLSHKRKPTLSKLPWWQKRSVTIAMALLGLLAVLVAITIKVIEHENHLATGKPILLQLAPVDPRGFMQGDYMALSYTIERDIFDALRPQYESLQPPAPALDSELEGSELQESELDESRSDFRIYDPMQGYVIVAVDEHNVGHFVRLADGNNQHDLAANERSIHYRIRRGSVQLATNAFFFQEGQAKAFEAAEYGLFRVNDKGEPLLTDMVDKNYKVIALDQQD